MSTWIVGFRSRCELLPEDTDEPERLELLDAAIPTGPDPTRSDPIRGWITPARPRCTHGVSCLPPPPVPPCQCARRLPHLAHYFMSRRAASPPSVWLRCSVPCALWRGAPAAAAACKEGRREGMEGRREGRCRIYSSGSAERRINTDRSGADPLTHPAQTGSAAPGLIVAQGSYGFHVPL